MPCDSPVFNVLLIDDKVEELEIIQRIFKAMTHAHVCVDHVLKCSEAFNLLNQYSYDLVLLDNRLSGQISAEFSVPFITSSINTATLAIISNDIEVPYLKDPKVLGVDHVIDKSKMISFLRDQLALRTHPLDRDMATASYR